MVNRVAAELKMASRLDRIAARRPPAEQQAGADHVHGDHRDVPGADPQLRHVAMCSRSAARGTAAVSRRP